MVLFSSRLPDGNYNDNWGSLLLRAKTLPPSKQYFACSLNSSPVFKWTFHAFQKVPTAEMKAITPPRPLVLVMNGRRMPMEGHVIYYKKGGVSRIVVYPPGQGDDTGEGDYNVINLDNEPSTNKNEKGKNSPWGESSEA